MKVLIVKILALISYLVMVAVNYLAVALPLAGRDTGAISNNYPNLFAPAGYAFSIWGLIYTLLGVYVIYQFWCKKDSLIMKINTLFIINALLNASWMFAWHYDFIWLSLLIMFGLLLTLIGIANILLKARLNKQESLLINLPFSVYFGWITVATIANVTVFLVSINWTGFGLAESLWTIAILLIGALIGSWRMLYDRSIPYGLVLVWAYGAILFKHTSESGFAGQYPSIIATAALCMAVFVGALIFICMKNRK